MRAPRPVRQRQHHPATMPFADTSTTPAEGTPGNLNPSLDYIHPAIAAGAGMGAQLSPARGRRFVKAIERAVVIFIPAPCIPGWKFEDGQTVELALLGARSARRSPGSVARVAR